MALAGVLLLGLAVAGLGCAPQRPAPMRDYTYYQSDEALRQREAALEYAVLDRPLLLQRYREEEARQARQRALAAWYRLEARQRWAQEQRLAQRRLAALEFDRLIERQARAAAQLRAQEEERQRRLVRSGE